jgi:hypothetical protein
LKRSEAVAEKKQGYLNWMKEGRQTNDLNILRQIIIDSNSWKCDSMSLDEAIFEKAFSLAPLPKEKVTDNLLKKELHYDTIREISGYMKPLIPTGKTVREQIESLLPEKLELDPNAKRNVKSLSYIFTRIGIERMPKQTKLPVTIPGLDCLSAAILSIYNISRAVDQNVRWLYCLWSYKKEEFKTEVLEYILSILSREPNEMDIDNGFDEAKVKVKKAFGDDDPFLARIQTWARDTQGSRKSPSKHLRLQVSDELARLKGFSERGIEGTIDVREISATPLDVLAIRPDGPSANRHERFLQLLRQEINILQYAPLIRLCRRLAQKDSTDRITAKDIEETSQFRGRSAFYALDRIENFLHERYMPSLNRLGLRYRYIFTSRQRPGVLSEGMLERMILNERDIQGCTVHVEPVWTEGPDPHTFPEGVYEAVVEDEVLSMRLEKYDAARNMWELDISDKIPKKAKRGEGNIEWSTHTTNKMYYRLTDRQMELISILWGFEGSRTMRKWLLSQIGYPTRTASRMLNQMRKAEVLKLLYLPALEFCRLPDYLVIMANCYDRRSRNSLIGQLSERLPYVRMLYGDSNDVVAHARIPAKMSDIISGKIREIMNEFSDHSFAGRLKETSTYKMTALHRIRCNDSQRWIDPWSV